jgi:hypothetical protein
MWLLQFALLMLPGTSALLTSPAAQIRVAPLGNHYAAELGFEGNLSLQSVVLDTGSTSLAVRLCSLIAESPAGCFENTAAIESALTAWNCSSLNVDGDVLEFDPVQATVNGFRWVGFNAAVSLEALGQVLLDIYACHSCCSSALSIVCLLRPLSTHHW